MWLEALQVLSPHGWLGGTPGSESREGKMGAGGSLEDQSLKSESKAWQGSSYGPFSLSPTARQKWAKGQGLTSMGHGQPGLGVTSMSGEVRKSEARRTAF